MTYWAVCQVEAQREHIARLLLMRAGFMTYCPRIRWRRRICPLFTGYVFVQIADRWYDVLWTPHVIRLLMAGDRPANLPDAIIHAIRKRELGGLVRLPVKNFKLGQKVKIAGGSFEGRIGIYAGMAGKQRERVLLELLGRQVPIDFPSAHITATGNIAIKPI